MKNRSIVCLIGLAFLLFYGGCTSEVTDDGSIGVAKQHLTIEQCQAELDACLDESGLIGLVTCNLDYTLCIATSEEGLPAAVADAIDEAQACRADLDECVRAAETPMDLAGCAEDQAVCVAGILDIEIPEVVTGAVECADDGVECINSAETLADLQACGETMTACAVENATSVLPDPVGDAINAVTACNLALDDCIRAATAPSELAACGEAQAQCVGAGLGVDVPDLPGSEIASCNEESVACTMDARSVSDLTACAEGLRACVTGVVDIPDLPDPVQCQLDWVRCLVENPLGFIPCAQELRSCLRPEEPEEPQEPQGPQPE